MSRGIVTFVFDDGYQHILDDILPLLDRYNLPAVVAVPLDTAAIAATEERVFAPLNEWLKIRDTHHEIAAHSVTHRNLTTMPDAELQRELAEPHQRLNATTLVYPGGAYDMRVATAAGRYYRAARTVQRGFENIPPSDPLRLSTYNFTRRNFSVLKANALVLWAWLTNSWLIETYHLVDDTEDEKLHAVRRSDFLRHVAFVRRLPVAVRTIQDVVVTL